MLLQLCSLYYQKEFRRLGSFTNSRSLNCGKNILQKHSLSYDVASKSVINTFIKNYNLSGLNVQFYVVTLCVDGHKNVAFS